MLGIFKKKETKTYKALSPETLRAYNQHRPLGPQKRLCYAPFKSLYFGHHGKVIACCYNRTYILGEYPTMSIREIWEGEKAEQLRDYIKNNDLTLGCLNCETQLLAGNFDAVKSKQYDLNKLNANNYPSVMEFELSNTCNLECEMCSGDFSSLIRAKREKLPPIKDAYDAEFVNQLEEFIPYLEKINFYGGEPFLIEIYYDIWERVKKLNPSLLLSVQTNGTVLNNRVKRIMESTNFHLNISLDSLQKENYERIRKNADFDRVMENISYFYDYCKSRNTFFGISVCAMQQNWQEIPDFITYCNKLQVPVYIHTVFYPAQCAIRTMKPEQLSAMVEYLQQFSFPANTAVEKKNKTHYQDFVSQVVSWTKPKTDAIVTEKRATTFDEAREKIFSHIRQNAAVSESDKKAQISTMTARFSEFEGKSDFQMFLVALGDIDINNPTTLDSMIEYFGKYSADDLIEMAKARLVN